MTVNVQSSFLLYLLTRTSGAPNATLFKLCSSAQNAEGDVGAKSAGVGVVFYPSNPFTSTS